MGRLVSAWDPSVSSRRPFPEAPGVAFVVHLEDIVLHDAEKDVGSPPMR